MKPKTKKTLIIMLAVVAVLVIVWLVVRKRRKNDARRIVEYVAKKQRLTETEKQSLNDEVKRLSDRVASDAALLAEFQSAAEARNYTLAQFIVAQASFNLFAADVSDSIVILLGRM